MAEPDASESLSGRTIDGRYEVLDEIGRGGMGIVYRARQVAVGRQVALKVLRVEDGAALESFEREANIVSRLRSPHTVTLFDFGRVDGRPFLVTEFLRGSTLADLLAARPLAASETIEVLVQVARALEEAHGLGIVHRDLKPANIFVEEVAGHRVIKVLDFGIAKVMRQVTDTHGRLDPSTTATGTTSGTPAYLSPEQVEGKAVDGRSDLYALGLVAYEMLAGRRPFVGDNAYALMAAHVSEPPPPMDVPRDADAVAPELRDLVMTCLEKAPADRPESAATLRCHLEALETSGPETPTSPLEAPARVLSTHSDLGAVLTPPDPRRWVVPLLLLLAIGLLALATVVLAPRPDIAESSPPKLRKLTFVGNAKRPDLSASGKLVAYITHERIGSSRIWVQSVDGGKAQQILQCGYCQFVRWLPHQDRLFVSTYRPTQAFLIGAHGEARQKVRGVHEASFRRDGDAYVGYMNGARDAFIFDVGTATITSRFEIDGDYAFIRGIEWSPTDERLAMLLDEGQNHYSISTMDIDGKNRVVVLEVEGSVGGLRWAPDGTGLRYARGIEPREIWELPLDGAGRATGPPTRIFAGPLHGSRFAFRGDDETLVYTAGHRQNHLLEYPVGDPTQKPRPLVRGTAALGAPVLAPDGRNLVYLRGRYEFGDLYRLDLDSTKSERLTADMSLTGVPGWSPSGRKLAVVGLHEGTPRVFTMPKDTWAPKPNLQTQPAVRGRVAWLDERRYVFTTSDWRSLQLVEADGAARPMSKALPYGWYGLPIACPTRPEIAYRHIEGGGRSSLRTVTIDGTPQVLHHGDIAPIRYTEGCDAVIVFDQQTREVLRVDVQGATPTVLGRVDSDLRYASMSADLQRLYDVTRETESDVWIATGL